MKEKLYPRQWLALFILLSVIGQVLISSIYMYNTKAIDELIYGRYNELFVPVTIMIGLVAMSRSRFLIPATVSIGAVLGGITFLLLHVIEAGNMNKIRGYHIAGISYLLREDHMDIRTYFRNTWLLGFGLMLLVCILVWIGRRWKSMWWIYAGILTMEIAAGIQISEHYTYRVNNLNYENLLIAEMIQDKSAEDIGILYLDEDNPPYVDFLQMQIPDNPIHVIRDNELSSIDVQNNIVITDAETGQVEALDRMFDKKISTNMFCLYYNL